MIIKSPQTCLCLSAFICSFACILPHCARDTISAYLKIKSEFWNWCQTKYMLNYHQFDFFNTKIICGSFLSIFLLCFVAEAIIMSVFSSDVIGRIVICGNALAARLLLHPNTRNKPTFQIYQTTMGRLDRMLKKQWKTIDDTIKKKGPSAQWTWIVCQNCESWLTFWRLS